MQVATRRLIIVSAIGLFGATAGIALGNFVARGPKISGMDELASYSSTLVMNSQDAAPVDDPDPTVAAQAGPNHYNCTGCDASLYNDVVGGGDMAASTEPLPPYQVEEEPAAPARRDEAGLPPRHGPPPGSAAPTGLFAIPVPLVTGAAQAAAPALPEAMATRE
jgi:hypothetical protein